MHAAGRGAGGAAIRQLGVDGQTTAAQPQRAATLGQHVVKFAPGLMEAPTFEGLRNSVQ